ncbi:hypothetical protein [Duganella sp. S19_KUP01_CR8]|uniref:hypothetical protein n=1 Tax=Duganella sp. S19_KUP01_CR8 TaxID=3025502 RepID=UPI002FCD9C40
MMSTPEQHDIDIPGSVFRDHPSVEVSASDRLTFAKQILLGLAIISSGIIAGYACYPANSALAQLSELVKIGALPIVPLVISFYFPNGSKK